MIRCARLRAGVGLAATAVAVAVAAARLEGLLLAPALALAAMLAGQVAGLVACARALTAAAAHEIGFNDALRSRWLRDAVANLCVAAPGAGEAAGVRALAVRGAPLGLSAAATATDLAGETLAQALYVAAVLPFAPPVAWPRFVAPAFDLGTGALLLALGVAAVAGWTWTRGAWRRGVARLVASARRHARALRGGHLLACTAWHLAAWAAGGLQVWAALRILGAALPLGPALALEGLVYLARAAAFAVPAGVGVQEAVLIAAGSTLHLPIAASVTLAALLRARDLVVGVPALALWLPGELKRAWAFWTRRSDALRARRRCFPAVHPVKEG